MFVFEASGGVPHPDRLDAFLCDLPASSTTASDSAGRAHSRSMRTPLGPVEIKTDSCTHILEAAYPPLASLQELRQVHAWADAALASRAAAHGLVLRHGCHAPTVPLPIRLRPKPGGQERLRDHLSLGLPFPQGDPLVHFRTAALQVTLNCLDDDFTRNLAAAYALEPLVAASCCEKTLRGEPCERLVRLDHRSDPSRRMFRIPSTLPGSVAEHAAWLASESPPTFRRDFAHVALRPPHLVEFRSGCSRSSVEAVEELVALRLAALALACSPAGTPDLATTRQLFRCATTGRPPDAQSVTSLVCLLDSAAVPGTFAEPLARVRNRFLGRVQPGKPWAPDDPRPPGLCTIDLARSEAERILAYRLRYDCFATELGDERYANHGERVFVDALDGSGGETFVARTQDGGVVGTVRLALRASGNFPSDDLYRWDQLARVTGEATARLLERTVLISRGATAPSWRRLGIMRALMEAAELRAIALGMRYAVAVISDLHGHSGEPWVKTMGYQPYSTGDHRAHRFALVVKDLGRLGEWHA